MKHVQVSIGAGLTGVRKESRGGCAAAVNRDVVVAVRLPRGRQTSSGEAHGFPTPASIQIYLRLVLFISIY